MTGNADGFGDLNHANLCRTAALGGTDRRNIDPDDSQVVELHCRSLFHRDRYLGYGANVTQCGEQCSDQRTQCSQKGGPSNVELGCNIFSNRAHRRCIGPQRCGRRGNSDRMDSVRRVFNTISRGLGHGSKTARLVTG